jgi:hypothetical protein
MLNFDCLLIKVLEDLQRVPQPPPHTVQNFSFLNHTVQQIFG